MLVKIISVGQGGRFCQEEELDSIVPIDVPINRCNQKEGPLICEKWDYQIVAGLDTRYCYNVSSSKPEQCHCPFRQAVPYKACNFQIANMETSAADILSHFTWTCSHPIYTFDKCERRARTLIMSVSVTLLSGCRV